MITKDDHGHEDDANCGLRPLSLTEIRASSKFANLVGMSNQFNKSTCAVSKRVLIPLGPICLFLITIVFQKFILGCNSGKTSNE